jgi:dehydrogenase/reductase SDR family protein 12
MGSQYSIPGVVQWYRQGKRCYGAAGFEEASKSWLASDFPATLEGQCHVVTGANSGLGFQVARDLAKRNASVHLLCRNQQRGEEAVRSIRTETGNENVHLHVCDVRCALPLPCLNLEQSC